MTLDFDPDDTGTTVDRLACAVRHLGRPTTAQVAEVLGCSRSAAYGRLVRAWPRIRHAGLTVGQTRRALWRAV